MVREQYPSAIAHQLFKLIRKEGLAKISYSLVSMNVPQAVLKGVCQPYFAYAQTFRGQSFLKYFVHHSYVWEQWMGTTSEWKKKKQLDLIETPKSMKSVCNSVSSGPLHFFFYLICLSTSGSAFVNLVTS